MRHNCDLGKDGKEEVRIQNDKKTAVRWKGEGGLREIWSSILQGSWPTNPVRMRVRRHGQRYIGDKDTYE